MILLSASYMQLKFTTDSD